MVTLMITIMRASSLLIIAALSMQVFICNAQEQKDPNGKGSSRRPTVNQRQEKPSTKETKEIEMNKNRLGSPENNTLDTSRNSRQQPGENAVMKQKSTEAKEPVQAQSPEKTNKVSIFETGASAAGSPSISPRDNGRDGTNTVQSATPNMAGSPVSSRSRGKAKVPSDSTMRRDKLSLKEPAKEKLSGKEKRNQRRERKRDSKD